MIWSLAADSAGNVYTVGSQKGVTTFTYGLSAPFVSAIGTSVYENAALVRYVVHEGL